MSIRLSHSVRCIRLRALPLAAAITLCLTCDGYAANIVVNNASAGSVAGACTVLDAVTAINTQAAVNSCAAGDGNNDTIDLTGFTSATTISFSVAAFPSAADGDSALALSKSASFTGTLGNMGLPLVTLQRSTVSGTPSFRLIFTSANINITGLNLSNGYASGTGNGVTSTAGFGGAIDASQNGNITIANSRITGNSASQGGGALFTYFGTTHAYNSTISSNISGQNGGAIQADDSSVVISGSTLSGNSATGASGGGGQGGAIWAWGTATLSNVTISGNSSSAAGGGVYTHHAVFSYCTIAYNSAANGLGGGLYAGGSTTGSRSATACIIAGNGSNDIGTDDSSIALAGNSNIIGTSAIATPASDINCASGIHLGPLANFGGATKTLPLLSGSCAIDAASGSPSVSTDQRGDPRPATINQTQADVGAFEKQSAADPITSSSMASGRPDRIEALHACASRYRSPR